MTKKLEELAAAKDVPFGKAVMDSATQIWLAGLGAFSKAQEEGTKIFESLVKEGEQFQKHARGVAEGTVTDMRERAADTWDKLEDVFEDRVSRTLSRLSVPTRKDVEALRDKVEELTAAVEKLSHKRHQDEPATTPTHRKPQHAHAGD
ncbi:MAG TPA: phasin family protein [Acetobacteraceae bacterium]|nr:phasin family protein [Acetobacteraceae bacterium]